jgi:hypothetical protein
VRTSNPNLPYDQQYERLIDLTLGANEVENLVNDWHVPNETSLSYHRNTCFQIGNTELSTVSLKDPKNTTWESYKDDLEEILS